MGSTLKTVSDQVLHIPHIIIQKDFQLFGQQHIRTRMKLGLHGIRTKIFGKRFCIFLYDFHIMFIFHLIMYLLFYFVYVISYSFTCFIGLFETMQISGMERLWEIVYSLQQLTIFAQSFILDVGTGSECVSGYFILLQQKPLICQYNGGGIN